MTDKWRAFCFRGNGERADDEMISKDTCRDGWRTIKVDLTKFAGQDLTLASSTKPTTDFTGSAIGVRRESRPNDGTALQESFHLVTEESRSMIVAYSFEPNLSAENFIDVLIRSTLAERRPVQDRAAIEGMLRKADVIVTARIEGLLVGVSRAITDFSFCTYLSDLAVDEKFQGQGIGKKLIRQTHEAAGLHTTLILLAAPKAMTYYPHIGMTKHESCWIIPRQA